MTRGRKKGSYTKWSPELIEKTVHYLRQGLSYTEVGAIIGERGHVIRNSLNRYKKYVTRKDVAKARDSIPCTHGWRPIETAPKTGDILLWNGFIHIGKYYEEYDCFYAYDIAPPLCYPTHWQPLPKPPQE